MHKMILIELRKKEDLKLTSKCSLKESYRQVTVKDLSETIQTYLDFYKI